MATDRYSDNHTISVSAGTGTLTVDGNLEITGEVGSINLSDIDVSGTANFSGSTIIYTPGGNIDFSSSTFEIKKFIPMNYLEWLDSNGYSSASFPPLFQPIISVTDTTSDSFTFSTPGLLFQSSGDTIKIPVHEFLRRGSSIRINIICEFEVPTTLSSGPFSFQCDKIAKVGSSTSPYYSEIFPMTEAVSFSNDTRKIISSSFSVDFDSSDDFIYLDIQRTATTGGDLVVYSIEISTLSNFYDIIGLT